MVFGVPTLSRNGLTEGERLGIEIRKVCVRPRRKERGAKIANGALDSPLLISFGDPDGTRLEPIVRREVPERGMEANGIAHALQDNRLEIVVQEDFGNAAKERKSMLVASKKETLRLSQKEADKQHAGVAEHHDKRGQRARGATARQLPKRSPIDLCFLCRKHLATHVGFCGATRTKERDLLAEVTVTAHVAALANLLQKTRSGEPRIALEHLAKVRNERVELAWAGHHRGGQTVGHKDSANRQGMDSQVFGDDVRLPRLDAVQPQNLGTQRRANHGGLRGMPLRRQMTMGSRRRKRLWETPQKSQKYSPSVDRERLRMRAAAAEDAAAESEWATVGAGGL